MDTNLNSPPTLKAMLALAASTLFLTTTTQAQTFVPTSGVNLWNSDANWSSPPFPNGSGAAATISAPTAPLTVDLGEPITVGTININKAATGDIDTTILGSTTNILTFDGGTRLIFNALSTANTGVTIFETPIAFTNGLTIRQGGDDAVRFMQPLSGSGTLTIDRDTNAAPEGVIAISNANTYNGPTVIRGSGNDLAVVARLNNINSIPGGVDVTGGTSNITLTNSAILGLRSNDFRRNLGTGPDQFQFVTAARSGWAAFIEDRIVNIGGASATVNWASAGIGQLTLGAPTADKTVDFQNPLDFGSTTRVIRAWDGTAAIDGKVSGGITATGTAGLTKAGDGTISLTAASNYTGTTTINGGVLVLNHASALPASSNLLLTSGGVVGLGTDDFTRTLGTAAGQVQFTGNGGFSAHGANRAVSLNGGAPLAWGVGSFLTSTANLVLSFDSADATVDFQNSIDLNGGTRTIAGRNGSAAIDAKITGVISGTGAGIIKSQGGTLELSNANTYDGPTQINLGVLLLTNANSIPGGVLGGNVANISISGTGGAIGLGQSDFTSGLGTGPGQIQFLAGSNGGFAAYGADRTVNLGGSAAQVVWGTGNFVSANLLLSALGADKTVDFVNPIDLNGAPRVVAARNGDANVDGIISGVISGTGGSLIKNGGGTLKLTAASTYDGGTSVTQGQLLVSNTTGSGTGSGPVAVTAGTLGGTGTIAGSVTVSSSAHIAPGESIGTLAVGSLSLSAGSILDFELAAPGAPGVTSDLLNVTATDGLTLSGGNFAFTDADGLAPGTYTLIDYVGILGGSLANLGTPTGPAGFSYTLINNTSNSSIDLEVASAPIGLPGDFNSDGRVDAGDFATWRKNSGTSNALANDNGLGTPIGSAHYDLWRANFGNPAASGSGLDNTATVPEPASGIMLASIIVLFTLIKRRHTNS